VYQSAVSLQLLSATGLPLPATLTGPLLDHPLQLLSDSIACYLYSILCCCPRSRSRWSYARASSSCARASSLHSIIDNNFITKDYIQPPPTPPTHPSPVQPDLPCTTDGLVISPSLDTELWGNWYMMVVDYISMRSLAWLVVALVLWSASAAVNTTEFWRQSLGLPTGDMHFQCFAGTDGVRQVMQKLIGTGPTAACTTSCSVRWEQI
jgi:hypothetical protein